MPELAEVEFFRKQWDSGLKGKILEVEIADNRITRGTDLAALRKALKGATFLASQASGKQLLLSFSGNAWVGVHLGMSGRMRAARPQTARDKHDHFVLRFKDTKLVLTDPRKFGRVLFHQGPNLPAWWSKLASAILSPQFTAKRMAGFLARHPRAPIKAALLNQSGFPGIGNWMADEVLWQARIYPGRLAGGLKADESKALYGAVKRVCRVALATIGRDWGDVPDGWLMHRRWRKGGKCPRDGGPLQHAEIAGRTTCWCPRCQKQFSKK